MRFPVSWLNEWVELPKDLELVKQTLMKAGVEIEAVESAGGVPDKVVAAKVFKKEAHPDADKLSLCQVDDGLGGRQIVCGATNFNEGDLVPLALPGAILPGDFKIKKSKIRGVTSEGMMCAGKELGISQDSDGLMILEPGLKPGTPLGDILPRGEIILTVETTANRPDHLCVQGLAREIAALLSLDLKSPIKTLTEKGPDISAKCKVSIQADEDCSVYHARIIRGLKVGPSPDWLTQRVEACGVRSINNVVDITNYVLFELGQPLHAFDLTKLDGNQITVRHAAAGESFVTLDTETRELKSTDLVIADAKKTVALAGVMGGANSEVTSSTADILLESAVFASKSIRLSSRRLGLFSEASYRFERGIDAASAAQALDHAASLMVQVAGGSVDKGRASAGQPENKQPQVVSSSNFINSLLGTDLSASTMAGMLKARGFSAQNDDAQLLATAPSWRSDIQRPVDLAEEIAQMHGVDSIEMRPIPEAVSPLPDHPAWRSGQALRDACVKLGLWESSCLSYLEPAQAKLWGHENQSVRIDNPISDDQSLLRSSLLPALTQAAVANLKNRAPGASLFEWGKIFLKDKAGISESNRLAIVLAGERRVKDWSQRGTNWDFFDLKGLLEQIALIFHMKARVSLAEELPLWLHPGQGAALRMGKAQGWLGALHPALLKALGSRGKAIYVLEMSDPGADKLTVQKRFSSINRLPAVERDLSCLVDTELAAGDLIEFFKKDKVSQRAKVTLKEIFEDESLGAGKRSLTFSIEYPADEKSLTDEEVNERHQGLLNRLLAKLPVELR